MHRRCVLALVWFLAGCDKRAAPKPTPPETPVASASAPRPTFTACGALDCRAYDDLTTAFNATLEGKPIVVAVGEAHGKKGLEWVDTSTKRFTRELLPQLEGRTSDLLLEQPSVEIVDETGARAVEPSCSCADRFSWAFSSPLNSLRQTASPLSDACRG